jgi:S-adenosylmethionine:tRNA ribosyltransferase-isomerase
VRPSRRVPPGTDLEPGAPAGPPGFGVRVHEDRGEGRRRVELTGVPETTGSDRVSAELAVLSAFGEVPLPPYITTPLADPDRYQTIYARRPASAAAPTAGLHLTDAVLARLRDRGVTVAPVELVVGLDTFRPIAAEQVEDHKMHSEAYRVPPATWDTVTGARAAGGEVVAIGTTAVRALESAAARGELEGRTDLYLHGDHGFAVVDRLLTNFHTPRSSLLVLMDAFVGPRWRRLYEDALAGDYRFLSFGDAMLLSRAAR